MVGHGGGEQVAEEESWSGFWGGGKGWGGWLMWEEEVEEEGVICKVKSPPPANGVEGEAG